jgi:hypothetical protein
MPGLFHAQPTSFPCAFVGDVDLLLMCKSFALHPQRVAVVFFS